MLSETMTARLNAQITLEVYSAHLYLQMSAWCQTHGLEGSATFLRQHANEEQMHMNRLFDYVNEAGGMSIIGAVEAPKHDFATVLEVFETTLEHEQRITKAINELVAAAFEEKDFSTFNFLQWYVAEQHEEENLFKGILDKAKLIGMDGRGPYLFDAAVGKMAAAAPAPGPAPSV